MRLFGKISTFQNLQSASSMTLSSRLILGRELECPKNTYEHRETPPTRPGLLHLHPLTCRYMQSQMPSLVLSGSEPCLHKSIPENTPARARLVGRQQAPSPSGFTNQGAIQMLSTSLKKGNPGGAVLSEGQISAHGGRQH